MFFIFVITSLFASKLLCDEQVWINQGPDWSSIEKVGPVSKVGDECYLDLEEASRVLKNNQNTPVEQSADGILASEETPFALALDPSLLIDQAPPLEEISLAEGVADEEDFYENNDVIDDVHPVDHSDCVLEEHKNFDNKLAMQSLALKIVPSVALLGSGALIAKKLRENDSLLSPAALRSPTKNKQAEVEVQNLSHEVPEDLSIKIHRDEFFNSVGLDEESRQEVVQVEDLNRELVTECQSLGFDELSARSILERLESDARNDILSTEESAWRYIRLNEEASLGLIHDFVGREQSARVLIENEQEDARQVEINEESLARQPLESQSELEFNELSGRSATEVEAQREIEVIKNQERLTVQQLSLVNNENVSRSSLEEESVSSFATLQQEELFDNQDCDRRSVCNNQDDEFSKISDEFSEPLLQHDCAKRLLFGAEDEVSQEPGLREDILVEESNSRIDSAISFVGGRESVNREKIVKDEFSARIDLNIARTIDLIDKDFAARRDFILNLEAGEFVKLEEQEARERAVVCESLAFEELVDRQEVLRDELKERISIVEEERNDFLEIQNSEQVRRELGMQLDSLKILAQASTRDIGYEDLLNSLLGIARSSSEQFEEHDIRLYLNYLVVLSDKFYEFQNFYKGVLDYFVENTKLYECKQRKDILAKISNKIDSIKTARFFLNRNALSLKNKDTGLFLETSPILLQYIKKIFPVSGNLFINKSADSTPELVKERKEVCLVELLLSEPQKAPKRMKDFVVACAHGAGVLNVKQLQLADFIPQVVSDDKNLLKLDFVKNIFSADDCYIKLCSPKENSVFPEAYLNKDCKLLEIKRMMLRSLKFIVPGYSNVINSKKEFYDKVLCYYKTYLIRLYREQNPEDLAFVPSFVDNELIRQDLKTSFFCNVNKVLEAYDLAAAQLLISSRDLIKYLEIDSVPLRIETVSGLNDLFDQFEQEIHNPCAAYLACTYPVFVAENNAKHVLSNLNLDLKVKNLAQLFQPEVAVASVDPMLNKIFSDIEIDDQLDFNQGLNSCNFMPTEIKKGKTFEEFLILEDKKLDAARVVQSCTRSFLAKKLANYKKFKNHKDKNEARKCLERKNAVSQNYKDVAKKLLFEQGSPIAADLISVYIADENFSKIKTEEVSPTDALLILEKCIELFEAEVSRNHNSEFEKLYWVGVRAVILCVNFRLIKAALYGKNEYPAQHEHISRLADYYKMLINANGRICDSITKSASIFDQRKEEAFENLRKFNYSLHSGNNHANKINRAYRSIISNNVERITIFEQQTHLELQKILNGCAEGDVLYRLSQDFFNKLMNDLDLINPAGEEGSLFWGAKGVVDFSPQIGIKTINNNVMGCIALINSELISPEKMKAIFNPDLTTPRRCSFDLLNLINTEFSLSDDERSFVNPDLLPKLYDPLEDVCCLYPEEVQSCRQDYPPVTPIKRSNLRGLGSPIRGGSCPGSPTSPAKGRH